MTRTDKNIPLINRLAADLAPVTPARARRLVTVLLIGAAVGAAGILGHKGLRPDVDAAVTGLAFYWKWGTMLALGAAAAAWLWAEGRPGQPATAARRAAAVIAGAALIVPAAAALALLGSAGAARQITGGAGLDCLAHVSLGAVPTFALAYLWLKRMAPVHPARAGFAAGITAGALSACAYAFACPFDGPLYVLTWYGGVLVALGALGAVIGRRHLAW